MDDLELEAYASEEASRLLAHDFSFFNPYTCIIESHDIPFTERDAFYQKVEEELLRKGEKIMRHGEFFKISRYQA